MKSLQVAVNCAALAIVAAMMSACAPRAEYARPSMDVPAAYREAGSWKPAQPRDAEVRGRWWQTFNDAELDALISQIDISNQNLRIAEAQYRQARALVQQSRAAFFPGVSAGVDAGRSGSPSSASRSGGVASDYRLSVDASWEADLWGRVRGTVDSAAAQAQASAAQTEAVRLSAQAELALNYFQLRALDEQRRLYDETLAALERSLTLTRNRYAAGVSARTDVVQAETLLRSTQAQAADTGVERAQLEHAIAVLIGKSPAQFALAPAPLARALPLIPAGVPSALLERRPDIAAAERQVAAANARIGVARTAYFPSLVLSATGGYQSSGIAQWLSAPSRFWALGASLAQSIFDAGLRRSLSDQAIASYDATVAGYRQTVLNSFQEVEDQLAALRVLEQMSGIQDEAVKSARLAVELTLNQYKAGTVNFLNVVVAQTSLLNNERAAVTVLARRYAAAVTLVRALGGGWHESAMGRAAQH